MKSCDTTVIKHRSSYPRPEYDDDYYKVRDESQETGWHQTAYRRHWTKQKTT